MRTAVVCADPFGMACLQALATVDARIVGLFTSRRERYYERTGRGMAREFYTDFSRFSREREIPVHYVKDINGARNLRRLGKLDPDILLVLSWSQILKPALLKLPPRGVLGFHPTLLPKRRGGAPINWAIIEGLKETGQTLMYYAEDVDSGDIVGQKRVTIDPRETCATLYNRLTGVACEMLRELWPLIESKKAPRVSQDHAAATYTPQRRPEDGEISWSRSARELDRLVRGVTKPFPGAFSTFKGKPLVVWEAEPLLEGPISSASPGVVTSVSDEGITIATGEGDLQVRLGEYDGSEDSGRALALSAGISEGSRFEES